MKRRMLPNGPQHGGAKRSGNDVLIYFTKLDDQSQQAAGAKMVGKTLQFYVLFQQQQHWHGIGMFDMLATICPFR
jgi:hypothetical protein